MIRRCEQPNTSSYKNYGGRGIKVCEEWHKFENFLKWAEASRYKDGLTIDRSDNDKGYCPENCTWRTRQEQSENRRNVRKITMNGETHTLSEWARITGLDRQTIRKRIADGCPPELILKKGYVRDGIIYEQGKRK